MWLMSLTVPAGLLEQREESVMQDNATGLTKITVLCGQCNCGCPEWFIDHAAAPERRIVITDDFGQRVQMSADQFQVLVEQARAGQLDAVLAGLGVR
jgi:hypothetical protein